MNYHVYILFSKNLNRFYVGHTSNLQNRLAEHNNHESQYTSAGTPWVLAWSTIKKTFRQAEALEFKLKNLTRTRKIRFMKKYSDGIHNHELLNSIE